MEPLEILKQEHRVIEQALDCLERIAQEAAEQRALNVSAARDAVTFFREFADKCHHGKEEARLFPLAEARGLPREGGPTGVMRLEHDQGRAYVRAMAEAIPLAEKKDGAAVKRFIEAAQNFIELLRDHIQKEDHCLFAMCAQVLSAEDQRALLADFEKFEREETGTGAHERLHDLVNALSARYGVSAPCGCGSRCDCDEQ